MQNIVTNVVKSLMMSIKELIYVAGPTAIGKTSISVLLAKYFKTTLFDFPPDLPPKIIKIKQGNPKISKFKKVQKRLF